LCFISQFNIHLNKQDLTNFVDDTIFYRHQNALEFISSMPEYQKQLHYYGFEKNVPTMTLDVDKNKCIFCSNSGEMWFEYVIPKLQKIPTLFATDKISNYYNYFNNLISLFKYNLS
jgi:hypothetical protein